MRKYLYITTIFILSISSVMGQQSRGLYGNALPGSFSIMLSGVGPAYLFGDVGGRIDEQLVAPFDWSVDHTRFMYSMGLRYLFPGNFGLKANIMFGNFTGDDANTSNSSRAYTFESRITEFSVMGEFVLWGGPFSDFPNRNTISIFAGAGVLHANSTLSRVGGFRPTDSFAPSITTPVIPAGISYQYALNSNLSVGAEFAWRYTFTDYLDGLSTPDSRNNDVLVNLSFTVNYKLYGGKPNEYRCNCNWW
jgi:hypothetical protein